MFTKAGKRRRGSSLREEGGHGLHGLTRIFLPDRLRRLANLLATKTHELTRKNTLKPLFRVFFVAIRGQKKAAAGCFSIRCKWLIP